MLVSVDGPVGYLVVWYGRLRAELAVESETARVAVAHGLVLD